MQPGRKPPLHPRRLRQIKGTKPNLYRWIFHRGKSPKMLAAVLERL